MNNTTYYKNPNPHENTNIFSKFSFSWFTRLCRKGLRSHLTFKDVYNNLFCDKSQKIGNLLEENWLSELNRAKLCHNNPKLATALRKTFFSYYMICGVLQFIQLSILIPIVPVLLGQFLKVFSGMSGKATSVITIEMCWYGGEIVLTTLLIASLGNHLTLIFNQLGMRVKIACASLLYKKILRLNQQSFHQQLANQIIQLLANDLRKFDDFFYFLHQIWIIPFQTLIVTYFICSDISSLALIGVGIFLLLTIPINALFSKLTSRLEDQATAETNKRIKKMDEIVTEIHVIKSNGWEKPFEEKVEDIRKEEINFLTMVSYVKGIITSTAVFLQRAMIFITTSICLLLGVTLTADQVFPMLQFYTILHLSLITNMPKAIAYWSEAKSTINQLQEFLLLDEVLEPSITKNVTKTVVVKGIQASWDTSKKTLSGITLNISSGSLCAIVGSKNSGKSSLLQLLLGELSQEYGTVEIGGSLSYSSQIPWIFTSTVRNNITFNSPYKSKRYKKVIEACGLEGDFKMLSDKDKTIICDKTRLTLAQRARINLARCIYQDADIYLLDDPLLFMNQENQNFLFEKCINGYLKQKTRIFVTNQLQCLSATDYVAVMKNGKIEAQGSYAEIMKFNVDLSNIITSINVVDDNLDIDLTIKSSISPLLPRKSHSSISNDLSDKEMLNSNVDDDKKTSKKWNFAIPFRALKKRFNGEDKQLLYENDKESLDNDDQQVDKPKNTQSSSIGKVKQFFQKRLFSLDTEAETIPDINMKNIKNDEQTEESSKEFTPSKEVSNSEEEIEESIKTTVGSTYWEYIQSAGSLSVLLKLILLLILAQLISNFADYWLTLITKQENARYLCTIQPTHQFKQSLSLSPNEVLDISVQTYKLQNLQSNNTDLLSIPTAIGTCGSLLDINLALCIYTALIILGVILLIYRSIYYYKIAMQASEHLHTKMLNSLLESPVNYFDENSYNHLQHSQELEKSYSKSDGESNKSNQELEVNDQQRIESSIDKSGKINEDDVDKFDQEMSENDTEEGSYHSSHGKIVGHFSKDVETVDKDLPQSLLESIQGLLLSIGTFVLVIIANPYMIIITLVIGFVIYKMRGWYAAIGRDLTIIENKTDFPLHSHVSDTLNGIVTIRALEAQKVLIHEFDQHEDTHTGSWYLNLVCSGAFGLWIDILTGLYIMFTIISFIFLSQFLDENVNSSYVGLAMSQSLILSGTVHYAMKQSIQVVKSMQSTKKVIECTKLEKEGIFETPLEEKQLAWPYGGSIRFINLTLRYSQLDEIPALKNITFDIGAGEKIGIVGPTGAGKTSLVNAILRFALTEGAIIIDEVNIEQVGLYDLRRKISLIPQKPVLFNDTLRFNLDPLKEFSDEQIWKALEIVKLKHKYKSLECLMTKRKKSLSVSQKQLLCLARAILRNNKILILDNALEHVNTSTNELIEEIIKTKFNLCTVLMIAHNLKTVLNSDKVAVLEDGVLVEFGYPSELLKNKDGYLSKIVAETNPTTAAELNEIADDAFMRNIIEIQESMTEIEEIIYL